MEIEKLFMDKLEELKRLANRQGGMLEKNQFLSAFDSIGIDLDEEQFKSLEAYLNKCGIGVDRVLDLDEYLSESEIDYLNEYLNEVNQLEKLSEGEKEAVSISAMAGDRDAQNKLIEIYLPYVADIAKLYAGQGAYLDDLISEGNVALAMGVTMLDCLEKPSEIQGMLGNMMMSAMEEFIHENSTLVRKQKNLEKRVNKILDLTNDLSEDLGRKVTPEELAREKNVSLKSILDVSRVSGNKIENLDLDK